MKCYIKGYNKSKYEADSEELFFHNLGEVDSFEVVQGQKELKEKTGWTYKDADPFDEYLIIRLADGKITSYRNSMVDLFRY